MLVVGAGPAGLSAAAEAASYGLRVAVFDENARPGGQLFKQIHKFFGSKEHRAKIRGFNIGAELLAEAEGLGVEVYLNAVVAGLYDNREALVRIGDEIRHYKGDTIVVATGASENMLAFDGWTLPGVMGAGAAQTMMNINRVRPGERVLMLGSGNVGLVVGFQLVQAGCELVAIADAAPRVGGYGVHASKLARTGVPFYLSHTIVRAEGTERVTGAVIGQVDSNWAVIPGTEKRFEVDTICIAVGLSSSTQLLKMAGAEMAEPSPGAGYLPVCGGRGETSIPGVFASGDVSGIEEASSAMIEGRISGASAANKLGFLDDEALAARLRELESALSALRAGMFAPVNRGRTPERTEEGIEVSRSLLTRGYLDEAEITKYPGAAPKKGLRPVIECTQNIPCDPCRDACPKKCIKIGENIVSLPALDEKAECIGCGMCVAVCSGQAIFLVNEDIGGGRASVTLPYEFLPEPRSGERGAALGRDGTPVCEAEVLDFKTAKAYDKTGLLTIAVPREYAMTARFWKRGISA
jgi:NADPH-dependent 2,4-dienoyl-CoA reductase/sulfur reductase-like enzyme/Pyruvate/2-oxoacid:ferredoxin oxidoreductase delta subunit